MRFAFASFRDILLLTGRRRPPSPSPPQGEGGGVNDGSSPIVGAPVVGAPSSATRRRLRQRGEGPPRPWPRHRSRIAPRRPSSTTAPAPSSAPPSSSSAAETRRTTTSALVSALSYGPIPLSLPFIFIFIFCCFCVRLMQKEDAICTYL